MKKFLCVIIALLLVATCTGCYSDDNDSGNSFVVVETDMLVGYHYKIVYHKDTKVMYVVGHYEDFTVMLNPDGSPMLYNEAYN